MLINDNQNSHLTDSELSAAGVTCINSKQWLPAYAIFKQLLAVNKKPAIASLYNMALCQFFAKEYQQSIFTLNQMVQELAVPSVAHQPTTLPISLLQIEYHNDTFQLAMVEVIVSLNMEIVKLRARRLLLAANLEMENWQEVIRLSALPEMERCKNVVEAIAIAKTKIYNGI